MRRKRSRTHVSSATREWIREGRPGLMNVYSIAIRYRRDDGKLAWFTGTQDAGSESEAEQLGRAAFAAEMPGTAILALFAGKV